MWDAKGRRDGDLSSLSLQGHHLYSMRKPATGAHNKMAASSSHGDRHGAVSSIVPVMCIDDCDWWRINENKSHSATSLVANTVAKYASRMECCYGQVW